MGIINRDLSTSEQRIPFEFVSGGASGGLLANGSSGIICLVPTPSSIDAVQIAAFGVSGAPTVQLVVQRFIPAVGTSTFGSTTFNLSGAVAIPAYGTSGALISGGTYVANASLPVVGPSSLLLANDVIMYQQAGGTGAATLGLAITLVLRPVLDQQKFFGAI